MIKIFNSNRNAHKNYTKTPQLKCRLLDQEGQEDSSPEDKLKELLYLQRYIKVFPSMLLKNVTINTCFMGAFINLLSI